MTVHLLLGHEDCNALVVKLRPAGAPHHLQDGAPVVLPVARDLPLLFHPAPGALQDDQVGWQVDALGQGARCA